MVEKGLTPSSQYCIGRFQNFSDLYIQELQLVPSIRHVQTN